MNITTEQKEYKKILLGKCYEYLNDNFHKFTEDNKIRIALELVKKDLPANLNIGSNEHNPLKVVVEYVNGNTDQGDAGSQEKSDSVGNTGQENTC